MNSLRQTHKRHVYSILVVGDQKVGKTALINALIGNEFNDKPPATSNIEIHAKEIGFPTGNSKVVILTEIPLIQLNSLSPEQVEKDYDLIAACFEHPNHLLRFLNENSQYLPSYVPKIGVHCKSDRLDFEVYMSADDEREINSFGIKKIIECSSKNGEMRDLLSAIYQIISKPEGGMTDEEIDGLKNSGLLNLIVSPLGLGILTAVGLGFVGYLLSKRFLKK